MTRRLLIEHATLFDSAAGVLRPNVRIVIEGDTIARAFLRTVASYPDAVSLREKDGSGGWREVVCAPARPSPSCTATRR